MSQFGEVELKQHSPAAAEIDAVELLPERVSRGAAVLAVAEEEQSPPSGATRATAAEARVQRRQRLYLAIICVLLFVIVIGISFGSGFKVAGSSPSTSASALAAPAAPAAPPLLPPSPSPWPPGGRMVTVTTLAGSTENFQTYSFLGPVGLAVNKSSGIAYVTEPDLNGILAVSPGGAVTRVLSSPLLDFPAGAVVYGAELLVADCNANAIFRFPSGALFAGNGADGSMDGIGTSATFTCPTRLAVDPNTKIVYVADMLNGCIRAITPNGGVTTLAGSADAGPGNADGTGTDAAFYQPIGITFDARTSSLYVADNQNGLIRQVTLGGVVTTLAGGCNDCDAAPWAVGTAASFINPFGVTTDAAGNVYVADAVNGGQGGLIRKVTPTGNVTTLAGGGGDTPLNGVGTSASFGETLSIGSDASGNLLVVDNYANRGGNGGAIRMVTPGGVVSTLASISQAPIDGAGTTAVFDNPAGIAVNGNGTIFIVDSDTCLIRTVTPGGVATTLSGDRSGCPSDVGADGMLNASTFYQPRGIFHANNKLYVADANAVRVVDYQGSGGVWTLAGSTENQFDGPAADALFYGLGQLVVVGENVYVADSYNNAIRMIHSSGFVTTLAGGGSPDWQDGRGADALFSHPTGLALSPAMDVLYVADAGNYVIRALLLPTGDVFTIAGSLGGSTPGVDGYGTDASFAQPSQLAVDDAGFVYVTDGNTVRMLTPPRAEHGERWLVSTVAGPNYTRNGASMAFSTLQGVAVGRGGSLYLTDVAEDPNGAHSGAIRKIS